MGAMVLWMPVMLKGDHTNYRTALVWLTAVGCAVKFSLWRLCTLIIALTALFTGLKRRAVVVFSNIVILTPVVDALSL